MPLVKRVCHPLAQIIESVRKDLTEIHNISNEQIDQYITVVRKNIEKQACSFPIGSMMVPIDLLWIDYQVQRDVILLHIASIIKRFDTRIVSPASSCTVNFTYQPRVILPCYNLVAGDPKDQIDPIFVYDGQHRIVTCGLLGFTEVPIIVVPTNDPSFPSYAFEECNMSTKKLTPGDIHRNRLVRHGLGNRDKKVVLAKHLQNTFDKNNVDLEDKSTRKSKKLRGNSPHFFSHFDYANKCALLKLTVLDDILRAITTVYPNDEEISQDLFIGLYELARQDLEFPELKDLDPDWMITVLKKCAETYATSLNAKTCSLYKEKAKSQLEHVFPGRGWDAPYSMSCFIRDLYTLNGGTLPLPTPGSGATLHLDKNPVKGLFPQETDQCLA